MMQRKYVTSFFKFGIAIIQQERRKISFAAYLRNILASKVVLISNHLA